MPDETAQIYEEAERFKAALLKRERAAASRMIRVYGQSWTRLSKLLMAVTEKIGDAQRRGQPISPAWLFQQERFARLMVQVEREMRKFADVAERAIVAEQSAAVKAALADSTALAGRVASVTPGITATFTALPVSAVESIAGFLGNGSPLRALLDELPADAGRVVADLLQEGIALGYNPRKTAAKIRHAMGMNLNRALMIARTETLRAYREATIQNYRANEDVVQGWWWTASLSRRTCPACIALHGTWHPLSERMDSHPRCLLPGSTIATMANARALTRRWTAGEAIEICTLGGNVLSVTPNHPILTPQGWIAAGLLHEGDYVVSSSFQERLFAAIYPNHDHVPATVEQIWETFSRSGDVLRRVMPSAPEYFHGDGEGGEVEIVFINSQLRGHLDATIQQPTVQQSLGVANVAHLMLPPDGIFDQRFIADFNAANSIMSSLSVAPMFFRCAEGHHQAVRFDNATPGNAGLTQATGDDIPRNVQLVRDLLFRLPADIPFNNVRAVDYLTWPIITDRNVARLKKADNLIGLGVELASELSTRYAGLVQFDQVQGIRRIQFKGHVYNLETASGWYIANNIITHNCRCTQIPGTKDSPPPLEKGSEWFAKQNEETQRAILVNKATFAAYKDGRIQLTDLVGRRVDPRWGNTYHHLSLKRALNGEAKFPGYNWPAESRLPIAGALPVKVLPPTPPAFVPAQTIKEAEQWIVAQGVTKAATYAGLHLEDVNRVNRTLSEAWQSWQLDPIRHINNVVKGSTRARASGQRLEFNPLELGGPARDLIYRRDVLDYSRLAKEREIRLERLLQGPITEQQRAEFTASLGKVRESLKYGRWSVKTSADDAVANTFLHETGHVIADQYLGHTNEFVIKNVAAPGVLDEARKWKAEWLHLFQQRGEDAYKISQYAVTNEREYFAECFVMYNRERAKLPKRIVDYFDRLKAYANKKPMSKL